MFNLYKTDLKRILKDRLFFIAVCIAVGFSLLNPLLNKFLIEFLSDAAGDMQGLLSVDAKTLFFGSFALGNNMGFICPIMLGIIICKDFSFGTVRNKIIAGHSRVSIFMAFFLSCATALCILIFFHAFLTLLVSLAFFKYQEAAFVFKDFVYLLASLGMELLVYLFVAALIAFLCVFMKNAGLSVVIYLAVDFLLAIFGGIISTARLFIDPSKELASKVLEVLEQANVFSGTYIGMTESYDLQGGLAVVIGVVVGIALFLTLGIISFNKKELK